MLDLKIFKVVVKSTPLVAIDFIIKDNDDRILFGLRENPPAKGMLCVPGGRIYKDESIHAAAQRKILEEVGLKSLPKMNFLGIYEHFYPESVIDSKDSTHYVTIAFEFTIENKSQIRTCKQHKEFKFIPRLEALTLDNVPQPIKNYLHGEFKEYLNLT